MLPTFIGLGAQRAGTTWAYNCLAEHPEVFMTRKKELHFFYVNYDRGLAWYEEQFAEAIGRSVRGEITPDYLYHEKALRNIAHDVPGVKTFVILRNPIDRAISAFALHDKRYAGMSFADACRSDPELVDRGLYHQHLQTVYRYLPKDRVAVLLYDDLEKRPKQFVRTLYQVVGVDPDFIPQSLETRYNRIVMPGLQRVLLSSGLGWVISVVKRTTLGDWIRKRNTYSRRESGTAGADDIAFLRDRFRDDVEQLSNLVGRDLRHWLE